MDELTTAVLAIAEPYDKEPRALEPATNGFVWCEACQAPQPAAGHECKRRLPTCELCRVLPAGGELAICEECYLGRLDSSVRGDLRTLVKSIADALNDDARYAVGFGSGSPEMPALGAARACLLLIDGKDSGR